MAASKTPTDPSETAHPEEHIREESLHNSSTDITEFDVSDVPPDLWFVESGVIVRADSEDAARGKVAAGFGVWADVPGGNDAIKVRRPTKKELGG